jgi:NAD(P)H-quinone oxidoreductase subunit 5
LLTQCIVFFICWVLNQVLLAGLMTHKPEWKQAKEGGRLFLRSAFAGSLFLLAALAMLAYSTSSTSIRQVCMGAEGIHSAHKNMAFACMLICAMAQSGIFPMHRWLISSLNSQRLSAPLCMQAL